MAKTESTAVNELIDLVQNGKPASSSEPAADLFTSPKSTKVNPARMTSPVPSLRAAGEVEPLPPRRAPQSTSKHAPMLPPPVRMSTAEPATGNTIPPLSRLTSQSRAGSQPRPSSQPNPSAQARPTSQARVTSSQPAARPPSPRPSAPPLPRRASSPRGTSQSSIHTRPTVPSVPSLPPINAPVAAPFDASATVPQQYPIIARPATVDVTGDLVKAENWFDVSAAVHKLDPSEGTHVVVRPRHDTLALVKKMIVPTILLAIVGVMIGGFFAFDGAGGKKKKVAAAATLTETAKPHEARVAMAATPTQTTAETPSAAAEAEPPTKAEEIAKQAAAESESMLPAATTAALTKEAEPAKAAPAPAAAPPAPAAAPQAPAARASVTEAPAPAVAAPAKAVATSGAPAPIREVQTPHGVVKLVDVRIDSKPSGATVMLVDNGKTSFLGSTPLATSVDPTKKYDVIFTLEGRPTQMAPLDPSKTSRLDVTLARGKSERKAKAAAAAKAPALDSFIDTSAKVETKKAEAPKADAPKAEKVDAPKAEKAVAVKEPAGEGTLMVSSKPPCEIHIDGKATGLTTPQKSIPLPAGTHKVTFVNAAEGIKKTVSVTINANQSTKLIQYLMKK